jgi:hypothetical protein
MFRIILAIVIASSAASVRADMISGSSPSGTTANSYTATSTGTNAPNTGFNIVGPAGAFSLGDWNDNTIEIGCQGTGAGGSCSMALYPNSGSAAYSQITTSASGSSAFRMDGDTSRGFEISAPAGDGNVYFVSPNTGGIGIGSVTATPTTGSYEGSATVDVASIAAGTCSDTSITVTSAAAGAVCIPGPPSALPAGLSATCFVSATSTVQFRLCNVTTGAIDPGAGLVYRARTFNP